MNLHEVSVRGWDERSKAPTTSDLFICFSVQRHPASESVSPSLYKAPPNQRVLLRLLKAASQERKTTVSQQSRILGIGGIFFKSAN
jgi:hypothetical protein